MTGEGVAKRGDTVSRYGFAQFIGTRPPSKTGVCDIRPATWRGGRVVDGAGLENRNSLFRQAAVIVAKCLIRQGKHGVSLSS